MKNVVVMLVALVLFIAVPASAGNLQLKSISGQAGVIFPEDLGTGFMLGASANMGELTENLNLVPLVGYWNSGKSENGWDWSFSNFQIGADVQYYLKDQKGLYFGGGLSLNFLSVSVDLPADYIGFGFETSSSDTKVGIDFLAGYEMPVGDNLGFANVKYHLISDVNTFMINVGMWFDMK